MQTPELARRRVITLEVQVLKKKPTSRIDFVCCDVACGDKVLDCRVVDEVDLTMDASVDHRMIMMTMHVDVCVKEQKRPRRE